MPVYNPGPNIDECIESLLGQTLPPDEYEVIFVDDGSSDGTEARLDALAAEHEHVRVEHIPNSGWPGKPRNLGIEMARGEYVYFVDNDDWLGKGALNRLYNRAKRDEADIVIGKVVGEGKFVARSVFKRDRKDVTLEWAPLVRLLTPHKLFRKALLDEHGIRFPEGRRRLEDHVFTMHAYFHARAHLGAGRLPLLPLGAAGERRQRLLRGARAGRLLRERPRGARPDRRAHGARPAARPREVALVPRQDARARRREQLPHARSRRQAPALRGDPDARARALRRRGRRVPRLQRARALAPAARRRLRRAWRRSRASRPGWRPRRRCSRSSPRRTRRST